MPVRIRTDVVVRADDGTELVTDIYLPEQLPAPVVVTRTPYDRAALRRDGLGWAAAGLVFAAQDVRGRYGSEGSWTPYRGERADGKATIDWVRAQPWCSGDVFVVGASYGAFTAWSAAVAAPQSVRGVISLVPAVGPQAINHSDGGVLRLAEHIAWWTEHADARTSRTDLVGPMMADPAVCRRLPVSAIGEHLWADVPHWWSAVSDGPSTSYPNDDGQEAVTDEEMASLTIPTLHIGGWYDAFLPQTLHQWEVLRSGPGAHLVIGPWAHQLSSPTTTSVGDRRHAPTSQLPLGRHQVEWIRSVLARDTTGESTELVYLAGDETWMTQWPPTTREVALYAGPSGTLEADTPTDPDSVRFVYDPLDPYPSTLAGVNHAPRTDGRGDVVRFVGQADSALTVTGRPRVRVVSSCAVPADRFITLAERTEDGALITLADGHVNASRGESTVLVTLSPIATGLPSTSRLELIVTAGSFPAFARHPQSDECRYRATILHAAEIVVHTGPGGTALWLPTPVAPIAADRPTPTTQE